MFPEEFRSTHQLAQTLRARPEITLEEAIQLAESKLAKELTVRELFGASDANHRTIRVEDVHQLRLSKLSIAILQQLIAGGEDFDLDSLSRRFDEPFEALHSACLGLVVTGWAQWTKEQRLQLVEQSSDSQEPPREPRS